MASKKLVLSAAGDAATISDAVAADIITSAFSQDTVLTGTYGLMQKAGLFVAGMAFQNNRLTGSLNPFAARG